ncbi:MAG: ABC transporter substrate-binding protein [Nitrospiraceae bacterium]|nr:MAG: ABC transporter substrate-binding protein [Nitrospiraceae bacterium]
MKIAWTFVAAVIFALIFSVPAYAVPAPTEAIKSTVDAVIETLKDKGLSGKKQERREKITALIKNRFDFEEMSRRSLATHWPKRTPEEKKEFTGIFSELLIESYIGKIESYTDEKITYDKESFREDGKTGVVDTTIVTKNVKIPIEYRVLLKGDKWWVYDVVIEGVSFISTYRSQYNQIIVRESYEGLVRKMKSKVEEIKALEDAGAPARK